MTTQTLSTANAETSVSKPKIDLEALVKLKLPPLNSTVLRISELLRDVNVTTKKLAEIVGCDPFLATRLLKLANSVAYSRQKNVVSIQQAIDAVGIKALYDIVMLGAMAQGFAKEIGSLKHGRAIWEHSIAVGLLARELSHLLGWRGTEESFLCGLLHDIGKILLLRADPELFETILEKQSGGDMLDFEEEVFGLNHSEVGAYVTYKWQLPEVVCGVIMNHHNPSRASISLVMTNIVSAADLIANVKGYGLRREEKDEILRSESVALLKLTRAQTNEAWDAIQDSLKEILATFK